MNTNSKLYCRQKFSNSLLVLHVLEKWTQNIGCITTCDLFVCIYLELFTTVCYSSIINSIVLLRSILSSWFNAAISTQNLSLCVVYLVMFVCCQVPEVECVVSVCESSSWHVDVKGCNCGLNSPLRTCDIVMLPFFTVSVNCVIVILWSVRLLEDADHAVYQHGVILFSKRFYSRFYVNRHCWSVQYISFKIKHVNS